MWVEVFFVTQPLKKILKRDARFLTVGIHLRSFKSYASIKGRHTCIQSTVKLFLFFFFLRWLRIITPNRGSASHSVMCERYRLMISVCWHYHSTSFMKRPDDCEVHIFLNKSTVHWTKQLVICTATVLCLKKRKLVILFKDFLFVEVIPFMSG